MHVKDFHGKSVIDSREVAEMVEKQHKNLLRDLDGNNQSRPCYLITKKGCDMIANKLTGEKGVLFTAAYVTAFEEMQRALEAPKRAALPDGVTFSSVVGFLRIARRAILDAGGTPQDVCAMISDTCNAVSFPVPSSLAKQLPGQTSFWDSPALEN